MKSQTTTVRLCLCSEGSHQSSYSNYGGRPALRFSRGMLGVIASTETREGVKRHNVYYLDPASNAMERIWLPAGFAQVHAERVAGQLFCGSPDALMQASLLPVMARLAPGHFSKLDLDALTIPHVGSINRPGVVCGDANLSVWFTDLKVAVAHYISASRWEHTIAMVPAV